MNENIKTVFEKVKADKELQAKFAKINDPEEVYKLAASIQDGFSKDEFFAEVKKIYDEHLQEISDEDIASVSDLSDDDIAKIAGGVSNDAAKAVAYGNPTAWLFGCG